MSNTPRPAVRRRVTPSRVTPKRVLGFGCGLQLFLVLAFLAVTVGGCLVFKSSERTVTTEVTGKERVCDGGADGECKYLIFTDEGTFQLTDSLLYWQWTSSDRYGRVKPNKTYTFQVAGFRVGIASAYPTIVSDLKEVQK